MGDLHIDSITVTDTRASLTYNAGGNQEGGQSLISDVGYWSSIRYIRNVGNTPNSFESTTNVVGPEETVPTSIYSNGWSLASTPSGSVDVANTPLGIYTSVPSWDATSHHLTVSSSSLSYSPGNTTKDGFVNASYF